MTSQNLIETRKNTSETQIVAIPKKLKPKYKLFIPLSIVIAVSIPLGLYFSTSSMDTATPEAIVSLHKDHQYSTLPDQHVAAAIGNLGLVERLPEAEAPLERPQSQEAEHKSTAANKQITASISGTAGPNKSDGNSRFIMPSKGRFTSPYGMRWGKLHAGIDIAAPIGTPVVAVKDGIVIAAGLNAVGHGYGNGVDIRHQDGSITRYGHAEKILVRVGQPVKQGEPIMLMGCTGHCTGPHVHFEIHIDGKPVDPRPYLS
jgi:murein DD-endopeptidase MepM/ murein hydrolase activator NlpD